MFLRRDFTVSASPEAVRKALTRLQEEGTLVRIGQGIYARARRSRLSGDSFPKEG
ncbi:DUF6088 family protein [Arhodomonas sp. AD133]|uniref:DUF6088 family protein n=1 Tax=Arhodomonas sp. AD133 TaxID=3415009 RepID=UPI003EBB17DA